MYFEVPQIPHVPKFALVSDQLIGVTLWHIADIWIELVRQNTLQS
jgi:hypothetical protein